MDELARAYATLGITPAASREDLRKRYKALVRQWHPDRFVSDPQGHAEATVRMRAINDAFRAVVAARAVPRFDPPARGASAGAAYPRSATFSGRRLTREEIDRMVEAMKNDGPFDWLMDDSWVEGWKEGWKRSIERPVSRSHLASYIAVGAAFIVPIWLELVGIASAESRRLQVACGAAGFGLAMWLLPKR